MSPARASLPAFASDLRDAIEARLSPTSDASIPPDDKWQLPAVQEAFHLEQVDLRGTDEVPRIVVFFKWEGESDLFGLAYPISLQDYNRLDGPEAYVSVYVRADLLALADGLKDAIRVDDGGVTWVRWRP